MSLTTILSLIFAVIFIYFLMSLICNAVFEIISALLDLRSIFLTRWIRNTLPGVYSHLLNHPLLDGLSSKGESTNYISSTNFTTVLFEIIARFWKQIPTKVDDFQTAFDDFNNPKNEEDEKKYSGAKNIIPQELQRVISIFISEAKAISPDAGVQMKHLRKSIEDWFDSMMNRVTGVYKRWAMFSSFIVAALITLSLNVDTIKIMQYLSSNPVALAAVVAEADKVAQDKGLREQVESIQKKDSSVTTTTTETDADKGLQRIITTVQSKKTEANDLKNQLGALVPIGWKEGGYRSSKLSCIRILTKIAGLLLTIFAVSLGAPFWYDLLCKVADLRSSVKPLTAQQKEEKEKK